jgi:hypothetical protein
LTKNGVISVPFDLEGRSFSSFLSPLSTPLVPQANEGSFPLRATFKHSVSFIDHSVTRSLRKMAVNSSNKCSVGIFIQDECFLSTFVPVNCSIQSIDSLSEDLRKTICYRTNMTTIPSICRHHLVAFSSRFSKFRQSTKCSNPLSIHCVDGVKSRNIPKDGKKSISLESCEAIKCHRPDLHVYPGQKLCTTCIKELVTLKTKEIMKKSIHQSPS